MCTLCDVESQLCANLVSLPHESVSNWCGHEQLRAPEGRLVRQVSYYGYVCIYIYIYLFIYLFIHLYIYIYLFIYLSIYLFIYMYRLFNGAPSADQPIGKEMPQKKETQLATASFIRLRTYSALSWETVNPGGLGERFGLFNGQILHILCICIYIYMCVCVIMYIQYTYIYIYIYYSKYVQMAISH